MWGILKDEEIDEVPDGIILRDEDFREVLATGQGVYEAIAFGVEHSVRTMAVYAGSELVAIWGYRPSSLTGSVCFAWMLSTPEAEHHKVAAARATKKVVDELLELYPTIRVSVDSRYSRSVRWLEWLHFRRVGVRQVNGVDFYDMERKR